MENKVFVCEFENPIYHKFMIIAASNKDVAKDYVLKTFNENIEPIWLMGSNHDTIYIQDGSKPKDIQVKILFHRIISKK